MYCHSSTALSYLRRQVSIFIFSHPKPQLVVAYLALEFIRGLTPVYWKIFRLVHQKQSRDSNGAAINPITAMGLPFPFTHQTFPYLFNIIFVWVFERID